MKKLLLLLSCLLAFYVTQAQSISTSFAGTALCENSTINVNYISTGVVFLPNNAFHVEISNAAGSFSSGVTTVGSASNSTAPSGSIQAFVGQNFSLTGTYRIRVRSTSPSIGTFDNGANLGYFNNPNVTVSPAAPIACPGYSVALTASGAATYSWLPGPGLSSSSGAIVSVSPSSNINYTVIGTSTPGCSTQAIKNVQLSNSFQTVFYETMGIGYYSNTSIAGYEQDNGFDNDNLFMSGSALVSTGNIQGGQAYIILNSTAFTFQISDINTLGLNNLVLSFSINVGGSASSGFGIELEASTNGSTWAPVTFSPVTPGGHLISTGSIPAVQNLHLRWRKTSGSVTAHHLDNIRLRNVLPAPTITTQGTPTICPGGMTMLTSSAGASYSWSNGETSQQITVTQPGAYTVTVNDVYGCAPTSAPVTVGSSTISAPATPVTSNNSPLCANQGPLQLSASSSPGATYTWSGPEGFYSTLQNVAIASLSQANSGTYTVIARNNIGCSSLAATSNVVVNGISQLIASNNGPVCQGSNVQLTATPFAGATYTWSGPGGFSNSQQTLNLTNTTPAINGIYTVEADIPGCGILTASTHVTVNTIPATPVAGHNTPVCYGQLLQFSASTATPGAGYSWNLPNGYSLSTQQNPIIQPVYSIHAGTYTVRAVANGCLSQGYATTTVAVGGTQTSAGASNSGVICPGSNVNFSANAAGAVSYSWTGPNNFNSTQQYPVIPAITADDYGIYSVTSTTSSTTCPTSSATVSVSGPAAPYISMYTNSPYPYSFGNSFCPGQTIMLTAGGSNGSIGYSWTGPNGFVSTISSNPGITNATAANAGIYTVWSIYPTCISPLSTLQISLTSQVSLAYSSSIYCANTVSSGLPITNVAGGSFTASPAGLSIIASTGEINLSGSSPGTYTISYVTSQTCSGTATTQVTITTNPVASFTYSQTGFCQSDSDPIPAFAQGAGAGVFTASPAGLTIDASTGIINVATSSAGTYTVTNHVWPGGSCLPDSAAVTVTILPALGIPVITNNAPVCAGQVLLLSTTGIPGANYTWTGPGGFNSSNQNVIINPVTLQHSGQYAVQTSYGGACASILATVQILVSPAPALAVSTNQTLNQGTTLFLQASGSMGVYSWSGPNGFVASGSNPYLQHIGPANSGAYTVTLHSGCNPIAAVTHVQVTPMTNISGMVYNDSNNNGVMDAGEQPVPNRSVLLMPGYYTTLTNTQGLYYFNVPTGNFTLALTLPNPNSYQTANPNSIAIVAAVTSANNNIGLYTDPHQDLKIVLVRELGTSPGFAEKHKITYTNLGGSPMSGTIRYRPDPQFVLNISTTSQGFTLVNDTLIWTFSGLASGNSANFYVYMMVPATTLIGTLLTSSAVVTPVSGDNVPANNSVVMANPVTASYDPNDKQGQPHDGINTNQVAAGSPITYTIRFQNTGNDTAHTVLLVDTLTALLNSASVQMLSASHNYSISMRENHTIEWLFQNIMLPDSGTNEPDSHGFVQFMVKPESTLIAGDTILNTAHIFFDFNEAIVTNTTQTPVVFISGTVPIPFAPLLVYPNPNNGSFQIKLAGARRGMVQVQLLNMLGQIIHEQTEQIMAEEQQIQVQAPGLPHGMYLLHVKQGERQYYQRVVVNEQQ